MSDWIVSIKHKVDGILTDVTSAVLRDGGNGYGVRRTDTSAVIVAAGTAMSHDGTGLYSYRVTGVLAGVTYQAWVEYVYNGEMKRVERTKTIPAASNVPNYLDATAIAELLSQIPPTAAASLRAASDSDKLLACADATADIDAERYQGQKCDSAQLLQFPRVAVPVIWDWDDAARVAVVPRNVKLACIYQADSRLAGNRTSQEAIHDGLASQSVGGLSESYRSGGTPRPICYAAERFLRRYQLRQGRIG